MHVKQLESSMHSYTVEIEDVGIQERERQVSGWTVGIEVDHEAYVVGFEWIGK